MIAATDAILLRTFPFSETSLVGAWLTRDYGRIHTMAKGAQRPRSPFLGQLDLFYTCEILFYEKPSQHLHILKECAAEKTRPRFREDWRACAAASYLTDLLYRISPSQAHHPGLFAVLDRALDMMDARGWSPPVLGWVELHLLRVLGIAPRLRHCAHCNKVRTTNDQILSFCVERGGVICPACAKQEPGRVMTMSPDVLAILTAWQRAKSIRVLDRTQTTQKQLDLIYAILGRFIQYHLDVDLTSRAIALDIVRR